MVYSNSSQIGLNPNRIRKQICVDVEPKFWKSVRQTNCYAYALGLDVNESCIASRAYQPGTIGMLLFHYSLFDIENMTIERRMLLDLEALNIRYKEVGIEELYNERFYFSKDWLISSITYSWPIALFTSNENQFDFHFLRKCDDGQWSHKLGWYNPPGITDLENKIITDPTTCNLGKYEYKKTYLLTLNQKKKW